MSTAFDFEAPGFCWIDCHDASQSVLTYLRTDRNSSLVVVLNFTPVPRYNQRIGVPEYGVYREVLNSDSHYCGGSNLGNGFVDSEAQPWMNQFYSLTLHYRLSAESFFRESLRSEHPRGRDLDFRRLGLTGDSSSAGMGCRTLRVQRTMV